MASTCRRIPHTGVYQATELRRLRDHLRTPSRGSHGSKDTAANARLQNTCRLLVKDLHSPVDPAFVWSKEGFGDATRDWVQDEWEQFGRFMDAMNDRRVAASDMDDIQKVVDRHREICDMKRAVVKSRKLLGPDLIMHGRVKRNGRKQTFTWTQDELLTAKHWTKVEWRDFVEWVHAIIDDDYDRQARCNPSLRSYTSTHPVDSVRCCNTTMKDYINDLTDSYEETEVGGLKLMPDDERKPSTVGGGVKPRPTPTPTPTALPLPLPLPASVSLYLCHRTKSGISIGIVEYL